MYFLEASTWACHAGCKKFCLPSCKRSCCASGAEPYHEGMFKDLLNYQDSLPPPPAPAPPLPGPPMAPAAAGQCAQGCPQTCAPSCQPREYESCLVYRYFYTVCRGQTLRLCDEFGPRERDLYRHQKVLLQCKNAAIISFVKFNKILNLFNLSCDLCQRR